MEEIAIMLEEINLRVKELEVDDTSKNFLLNDLHRVRGRMMGLRVSQDWQRVSGEVKVTIHD